MHLTERYFRRCCNTCSSLKDAYDAKGWSHSEILNHSEQCIRDNVNPFADAVKGEGCRINGYMTVNKVAGNFHIAHGESIVRDGRHIHQFVPAEAHTFNISHTLHSVSFGLPYPNMPPNPLDKGILILVLVSICDVLRTVYHTIKCRYVHTDVNEKFFISLVHDSYALA